MNREEFIKQRCEIDKITEEEFEEKYRVVKCNCGNLFCNGYRCLDLDDLLKENQELEKQLEETDRKLFFTKNELDMRQKSIDNKLNQQKEFINYLEKRYKDITSVIGSYGSNTDMLYGKKDMIEEIFQKYQEIEGSDSNE